MPRFNSREEYEAWKNGRGRSDEPYRGPSVPAAATAARTASPPRGGAGKASFIDSFKGLPPWAWCFVAPCLAIPAISLGGVIPFVVGFSGAAACSSIAKKEEMPLAGRVLGCAGVTVVAWSVFLGFAAWITSLQ